MAQDRTRLRQRGKAAAPQPLQQPPAGAIEPTFAEKVNFYFAQHIGLVVCAVGVALLWAGYDKGWMHNTHLCMLSLGVCLLGLFFHELRPFNAQKIYEDEKKAVSEAAS